MNTLVNIPMAISKLLHAGSVSGPSRLDTNSMFTLTSPKPSSTGPSEPHDVITPHKEERHSVGDDIMQSVGASGVDPAITSCEDAKGVVFVKPSENRHLKSSDHTLLNQKKHPGNDSVLIIRHLSKAPLLADVSASVVMGEVFCFVSSDTDVNSEILRCIAGKDSYEGQILFNYRRFGWRHPTSPVTMGYCSHDETFSHVLTPREVLTFHCTLRGVINVTEEVRTVLKVCKLSNSADMAPQDISEGSLARLRVAKAVVGEPDVILLDRPLANLDSVGKVTVWKAINRTKKRGKMVIMTSNSIDECANLASRVAIIVHGQVMFVSSPKGIRNRFSNSYSLTARLGSCEKHLVDILVPCLMQRFPDSEIFVDSLNYLHVLLPFRTDSLADIFRLMASVKKHLKVTDFVLSHTTLDNVIDALEKDIKKVEKGETKMPLEDDFSSVSQVNYEDNELSAPEVHIALEGSRVKFQSETYTEGFLKHGEKSDNLSVAENPES
ncbi:ATP-binding cassette sub-family A member 1-like [Elysia marginata]|uniref:ATP-binding cassette sub-family A member 1-like n=1 Tax=Elysia marginata TaxID=1093978 RepID=A0AAV4JVE9_9GAST|nr:ATP-binding cassette sub-family A member 1-like [Elysia marginata]